MSQVIIIGVWTGNYAELLALLTPYSIEIRVRVNGSRVIIKDPARNFRKCIPLGSNITIPHYEPSLDRAIQDFASDVAELWECCDISETHSGDNQEG